MHDPYIYDDTDVLINKVNIKDKGNLEEFENRMSNLALVKLIKTKINIKKLKIMIFKITNMLIIKLNKRKNIF